MGHCTRLIDSWASRGMYRQCKRASADEVTSVLQLKCLLGGPNSIWNLLPSHLPDSRMLLKPTNTHMTQRLVRRYEHKKSPLSISLFSFFTQPFLSLFMCSTCLRGLMVVLFSPCIWAFIMPPLSLTAIFSFFVWVFRTTTKTSAFRCAWTICHTRLFLFVFLLSYSCL